ncbi:hypothetical protein B0J14DRAFT_564565 [Halenospora varia]|nr:hypothetical protein B0J14DRAFT_564565 [Halenospora varia]
MQSQRPGNGHRQPHDHRVCPNSGDDMAGTVVEVGSSVVDFRSGDRGAALDKLGAEHGAYAEYAIAYQWNTFHLGPDMKFEDAATVPMANFMAAIGLFAMLRVTTGTWDYPRQKSPLVVYGASSAVGAAAVRLAKISGLRVICIAGGGKSFVETLIDTSKEDVIVDYRQGAEKTVKEIESQLGGKKLIYAFDVISEKGSQNFFWPAMDLNAGQVSFVLWGYREDIPKGIEQSTTMAGSLWKELMPLSKRDRLGMRVGGKDFGRAYSKLIRNWLREGQLKLHPHEVVPGGLKGLEFALKTLRNGKSSAKKYVISIEDTPGIKHASEKI